MKLSVVLGLPFGVFCMYAGYDAFVVDRQPLEGGLWVLASSMFLVTGFFGDIQALTGSSLPDQVLEVPPG